MFVPDVDLARPQCQSVRMLTRCSRFTLGVLLLLALACSDETRTPATEVPQPDDTQPGNNDSTPAVPVADDTRNGGQTGSGEIGPAVSCEQLSERGDDCASLLRGGFALGSPTLDYAGAECVMASAIDAALGDSPVCRCSYSRLDFSDSGGRRYDFEHVVGLAPLREMSSEPQACALRLEGTWIDDLCLLPSSEFPGCSLEAPGSSCIGACAAVGRNYYTAITSLRSQIEVRQSACMSCSSGRNYCLGALQVGTRCVAGRLTNIGEYLPELIGCDTPLEELISDPFGGDSGVCSPYSPPDAGGALPIDSGVPLSGDSGTTAPTMDASTVLDASAAQTVSARAQRAWGRAGS
jgi:hypothetical protein